MFLAVAAIVLIQKPILRRNLLQLFPQFSFFIITRQRRVINRAPLMLILDILLHFRRRFFYFLYSFPTACC
jgi:hypothetical protein